VNGNVNFSVLLPAYNKRQRTAGCRAVEETLNLYDKVTTNERPTIAVERMNTYDVVIGEETFR
jgi:hypothetical protein